MEFYRSQVVGFSITRDGFLCLELVNDHVLIIKDRASHIEIDDKFVYVLENDEC